MKKRLLYYKLEKKLLNKNILIITGMRQVGKTTIMKQLCASLSNAKTLWFDFDNPLDQKVFEDIDYKNIYQRLAKSAEIEKKERLYVFIDEIQNYPEITKILKYLLDHYGVKFIVTGSSCFYLKNLFPESLAGRKFLYELWPLSFQEFLYFKNIKDIEEVKKLTLTKVLKPIDIFEYKKYENLYEEYLLFGGFPEVVTTRTKQEKKLILKNIFASFFEKDLKILSDYKDIKELRDLILLLVPRVGSMIDITKISSELGVSRQKIYSYLEFLQGVFFIKLLPKFSNSVDRSVAGGRKVYFTDNGILNIIGQVNESQILENSLINQISQLGVLNFYNKRNSNEIDVIVNKQVAIEIKIKGSDSDYLKLKKLSKKLNIKKKYIASKKFTNKRGWISAQGL